MSFDLRAVLFDCDGVIADSEASWNDIDREFLRLFGVSDYHGQFKPQVLGKSLPLSTAFYRDTFGIKAPVEEMLEQRVNVAQKFYAQHIPLLDGAGPTLEILHDQGLKIALATSSVGRLIRPFLERHDIARWFDCVVTGEQVKNGKPHPDIYLKAAAGVGVAPEQCLVVEDALSGLQSGRGAGCLTVALPDARWLDPREFEGQCDFQLQSLRELPALVEQLRAREAATGAARLEATR